MDVKKQQWSIEETNCLCALWSTSETQNNFEGGCDWKQMAYIFWINNLIISIIQLILYETLSDLT